jgi:hypothetical protein
LLLLRGFCFTKSFLSSNFVESSYVKLSKANTGFGFSVFFRHSFFLERFLLATVQLGVQEGVAERNEFKSGFLQPLMLEAS